MTKQQSNQYIPGVCNIGKDEIRVRRNNALLMASIALVGGLVLYLLNVNPLWRWLVLPPLVSFGIGIQQWRKGFCVFYGMKGLFNFEKAGERVPVEFEEMVKKDQATARGIIIYAILFALIFSALFYVLP